MIPSVLHELLTAVGPSGSEAAPAAVFRRAAAEFAAVSADRVGNSFARIKGAGEGPTIAVFGHVDEIGLLISHIDDQGFLWFLPIGGWDPMVLVGQRVWVVTKEGRLPGVVGKKPIHLLRDEERSKAPKGSELHIDVGAEDGDEARALVQVGDIAVIAADPVELPNDRIAARALDNRLGVYVAYESARLVSEAGGAPGEFVAIACTQEETTFGGSITSAFSVEPDVAIVVDVTHATDAPGIEEKDNGRHALGSGVVIVRGPALAPVVWEVLHEAAVTEKIEYTVEAASPRTGTDADAVHASRAGISTGIVSIPLRYMHSPVEVVQLSDVEACAKLIAAFAQRMTADVVLER